MEDIDYLDDEIDLVKLVSTNADVTNQYIIFEGSNAEYYAINVAKVEELFIYPKDKLLKNNNNPLIKGMIDIRSHMTPVVCFDEWYGNPALEEEKYELMIFCYFSLEYVSILVKQVVDIVSIMPQQMQNSSSMNELSNFVAKINIANKTYLCTIFDTDKLLFDMYGERNLAQSSVAHPIETNKYILFADDSRLVRKMAQNSFEKLGIKFQIFNDGQELIDALQRIEVEDIGLFLLDVEMPRKSGIDVIDYLKKEQKYLQIPIIVHTNMSNTSIRESLNARNVSKIIGKIDFKSIEESMREYML